MAEDIKNVSEELDDDIFITLEFEDGTEMLCEIVMIFEVDGKDYVALASAEEDDEDDGTLLFYNYAEDEDFNPIITEIEDDDVFDKVSEEFDALVDSMAEE